MDMCGWGEGIEWIYGEGLDLSVDEVNGNMVV